MGLSIVVDEHQLLHLMEVQNQGALERQQLVVHPDLQIMWGGDQVRVPPPDQAERASQIAMWRPT